MLKSHVELKGQYGPFQADRKATDVHSAKPTVVTGSHDVTVHRDPPGKESRKDFNRNYEPGYFDEGSLRGLR